MNLSGVILSKFLKNIFSIEDYSNERFLVRFFGFKIYIQKRESAKLRRKNPYYYYKKNNLDITTVPVAEGQLREIQLANLALLKELDYVCRCANIPYWLEFGTLLGAIRHRGYIPWDDDIDVSMMASDCEKLLEVFNKYSRNPDIYISKFVDIKHKSYLFKVMHKKSPYLFVDVFLNYDWHENYNSKDEAKKKTAELKDFVRKCMKNYEPKNEDEVTKKRNNLQNEILRSDLKKENKNVNLIYGIQLLVSDNNWFRKKDTVFPLKEISFEGLNFYAPNDCDKYLEAIFGNYMDYPKKITLGHNAYKKFSEDEYSAIKEVAAI